jgi:LCP family protein required for cell wall assembly
MHQDEPMAPARDDDARPLPQGSRGPEGGPSDDVYVVDVRGRKSGRRADQTHAVPVRHPGHPDDGGRGREGIREEPRTSQGGSARGRRTPWGKLVVLLVALWLAFMIGTPLHAWSSVTKIDTTPAGERPADTSGFNYLLVGSDSREGLTAAEKKALGTGSSAGKRTDSIILVHVPEGGGKSSLISIPRDSFVPIPEHGSNKINAAYAIGGPNLLVQTVEQVSDVHIDGYVEIGFGGFAKVVDSLGGVNICVPFDMDDEQAHINLKKGCQTLNGPNALGFVRARYSDPRGDVGRAERQRQFLGAIMKKALSPATVFIPTRYWGFTHAAAAGVSVGDDTSMRDTTRVLQAMRSTSNGEALSLVVPIQSDNFQTSAGSAVKWNTEQAKALFTMLREDTPMNEPPPGTDGKPSGG